MGLNPPLNRKLRMALVGGGQGSFIGRVHSIAACLDNRAVVTAGALSSNPERAKASAPDYGIDESRAYTSCYDGVEGMYFIQQCVASSEQDAAWLPLNHQAARC